RRGRRRLPRIHRPLRVRIDLCLAHRGPERRHVHRLRAGAGDALSIRLAPPLRPALSGGRAHGRPDGDDGRRSPQRTKGGSRDRLQVARMTVVLVDAENTRRSRWPNVSGRELVELCGAWAESEDVDVVVVFDCDAPDAPVGPRLSVAGTEGESADDWIARRTAELRAEGRSFWLVTSDRELRA